MKTQQVSVRIPIHLKQLIDEEAENTNETSSQIIIRHLRDYYQSNESNNTFNNSRQQETVAEVCFDLCKIASKLELHKNSQAKKIRKCAKQLWAL